MASKQLYVELIALTDKYTAGIDKAYSKLEVFGDKTQKIGLGLTAGLTVPMLALGFASVKTASDLEESMNKIDVAFKSSSGEAKKFADQSLNAYGISRGHALDMAALFGDMATSMGLPVEKAALMSTSLVGLTSDLASFKNVSNEVASNALKGIFTGEGESLKGLGIIMQDSTLKAYALSKGVKVSYEDMDQASKVSLRYAYVMEAAKNAQGDFARTAGGAANQMRSFPEILDEIKTSFGEFILPMFTEGISKINGLLKAFNSLDVDVKKNILMGAVFVAAVGPTLVVIGSIIKTLPLIGVAFGALISPIGIFGAAMAGTAIYVMSHWDKVKEFFIKLDMAWLQTVISIDTKLTQLGLMSLDYMNKDVKEAAKGIGSFFSMGGSSTGATSLSKSMAAAKLELDELLKGLKGGAGKGAGGGSAIQDYTFEMALLAIETQATNDSINSLRANMERRGARAIKGDVSAIAPTMSRSEDLAKNDKGLIDQLFGEDLAKSTANLQAKMNTLMDGIKPVITDFSLKFSEFVSKNFETIQASMSMGVEFLGDTLATGLASIFNKNIKFDFSKMLGGFLSSLGDMFLKMATPMIIGGLLMNIGLPGSGTAQLGSGLKLGALAVGLKAGGMALSAGSSNSMVANSAGGGGQYNNSSPSFNGYQAQGMTIKIEGELKGKGTDLVGVINNVTRTHGNNG